MSEKYSSESILHLDDKPDHQKVDEIKTGRDPLMEAKRESLAEVKHAMRELFGQDELPKELRDEMIDIRHAISEQVRQSEYSDGLDLAVVRQIRDLSSRIAEFMPRPVEQEGYRREEAVLAECLERYFDAYRLAHNAINFKNNFQNIEKDIVLENAQRKLNFFSQDEKSREVLERLKEKYLQAGFTEQEIKELVETCDLKKLDSLEIHDIKILARVRNIFERFMEGDKTKYVALSAGLLVPAFIDGFAPMFLVDAFKKNQIDMTQVAIYAMLEMVVAGSSLLLKKQFNNFLNQNFSKSQGMAEHIAGNLAGFPAEQIGNFGMATIKSRITKAKDSYEDLYRLISFDILPAMVTLLTSAAVIYEKAPSLAFGTAAGAGLMMVLDKYMSKATGWWGKQQKAEIQSENAAKQMEEQLNAHMEIIVSGLKEQFANQTETLLGSERVANSDRQNADTIRETTSRIFKAAIMVMSGAVSALAGGSSGNFIAALVYSGNFQEGISRVMSSRREMAKSLRGMQQMEMMFNGYAAEEKDKEQHRVGVDKIISGDIDLKNVILSVGDKKILDVPELHIPQGSMVNLSGVTGSGKTTLFKMMIGYYKPTAGDVRFGDVNIDSIKKSGPESIYSSVSYLPQFPYILESTVKDNVKFGLVEDVPDRDVVEVLKEVGLGERFANLNEKLKGGRGDMGTASGGETSRLGLARVLLKIRHSKSRLVFLDEPTASVDAETSDEIAKVIKKEKQSRPDVTFIVISHDRYFMQQLECDKEVKIVKGKVVTLDNV